MAVAVGDVDCDYPLDVRSGVPLGVDSATLSDPGVWPTKFELGESPKELEPSPLESHANYLSGEAFAEAIKKTFQEEIPMGMVSGPFANLEEVSSFCECPPDEVVTGALAAIDEGDKIRTIFDATISEVNNWIRKHLLHKTTAPTLHDLMWARMRLRQSIKHQADRRLPGRRFTLFKSDVSKAHRRVKVRKADWKYMVAHVLGEYWVNQVGTYGVASAQYFWGLGPNGLVTRQVALPD